MREPTVAVYWNELGGPRYAGRIRVGSFFVELAGISSAGTRSLARILFGELASSRYERGRLHLERHGGTTLEIGSVDKPGALGDVARRVRAAMETDRAANGDRRRETHST